MQTIYISGPISSDPEFKKHFKEAEDYIRECYRGNVRVINPARLNYSLPELTYQEYMRIDYELIKMSNTVFTMPGWEKSAGAVAEVTYAMSLGIRVTDKFRISFDMEEYMEKEKNRKLILSCCGDCPFWKPNGKCAAGAVDDEGMQSFYKDCPLPETDEIA